MSGDERVLVLVTGTGRSGTSTMAGTLHHLGLHVPGPFLGANESNPKGFYESRWATRFHRRITARAGINDMDGNPNALERAREAVTPKLRAQLREFVAEQSAGHDQVVVKDPRSVWAQALWLEAAAEAGLGIRYLSMLRHPAEVVGSRSTYYADRSDEARQRRYETFTVARWINNSLVNEHETRGARRSFVLYTDLLEDWRPAVTRLGDELGLRFDGDLAPGTSHPVDDFIEPGLRRVRVTWDDLDLPPHLVAIAEEVWGALVDLGRSGGVDEAASARLDDLGERYRRTFEDASAIAHDATEEAVRAATAGATPTGQDPAPRAAEGPRVAEVGGRELLREAARRAAGRLRRRG